MPEPALTDPAVTTARPPWGGWTFLVAALAVSIPLHLALALWLSTQVRSQPGSVEPAVLDEVGVADAPMDQPTSAPEATAPASPLAVPADPGLAADPSWERWDAAGDVPAATPLEAGGAPEPSVLAPGASAGSPATAVTASFFGVRARGVRFAFIVDGSASMGRAHRMTLAIEELLHSVEGLPDYASFRVCFFRTGTEWFPERGYRKAREPDFEQLRTWLARVAPSGGTEPRAAFGMLLAAGSPPDAIFFLTDGEIPADDPDWIVRKVRAVSDRVPVHCVALGDPAASGQLMRIARATGGQFRFVAQEPGP